MKRCALLLLLLFGLNSATCLAQEVSAGAASPEALIAAPGLPEAGELADEVLGDIRGGTINLAAPDLSATRLSQIILWDESKPKVAKSMASGNITTVSYIVR